MPEPSEYVITPKGVKDWPTDTDAVIAAVKGCQQGMGGIFPNGTASFYVHSRDREAYERRRAHLDRIAAKLADGTLMLAEIRSASDDA